MKKSKRKNLHRALVRGIVIAVIQTILFGGSLWLMFAPMGSEVSKQVDGFVTDRLFRLRNRQAMTQAISPAITLVGIDDHTIDKYGAPGQGMRGSRLRHVEFASMMSFYRPRVLAYDIIFANSRGGADGDIPEDFFEERERSRKILQPLLDYLSDDTGALEPPIRAFAETSLMASELGQIVFAQSLGALRGKGMAVLLGYYFSDDADRMEGQWSIENILGDDPDDPDEAYGVLSDLKDTSLPVKYVHDVPQSYRFIRHPPTLPNRFMIENGAISLINVPREADGVVRRYPMLYGWECRYVHPETKRTRIHRGFAPTLGFQAALSYWGLDLKTLNQKGALERMDDPAIEVFWGDRIVVRRPDGTSLRIPIDDHCRTYLDFVGDVSDFDNVPFATVDGAYKELIPRLRDKIVFVGETATGSTDIGPTPINEKTPFVHVHVTAANSLLTGIFIRELNHTEKWRLMIGLWLILTPLAFCKPRLYTVLLALTAGGYGVTAYWGVLTHKYVMPVTAPLAYIISAAFATVLVYYFRETRERRRIRGMFKTMVSAEVLSYMEHNPGSFSLAGESREATMFFSDVAGFTTISESLTPEDLVRLLNAYLTPMTEIILGHKGYVDKYEGDAIMAEWGVPFEQEDHAVLACYAALDQQNRLGEIRAALKEEFGHELTVRMGLNSGRVSAGNMGSADHFSYTVMGDAVNQAARFEPANKDYGTSIIIGETTYRLAKDHIEARLLDKIVVKGKTVPILIYELIGRKGELSEESREVFELYEKALKIHWYRQFDKAIDLLSKALAIRPTDAPSISLRRRMDGYKRNQPSRIWQGEYVRATKD